MSSSSDLDPESLRTEASGEKLGALTKTGLGALILGLFSLLIQGAEAIFDFLILPFNLFYDVAETAVNAVFITPWNILTGSGNVEVGAIEATAIALSNQFGFLTLPMATGVVLFTILIVVGFLALGITSNWAPGVSIDNPLWDFFFGTAEEEGDEEG